jgi:hypothetical protein
MLKYRNQFPGCELNSASGAQAFHAAHSADNASARCKTFWTADPASSADHVQVRQSLDRQPGGTERSPKTEL